MEKFNIYDWSVLTSGEGIELKRHLYCNDGENQEELSNILSLENINTELEELKKEEKEIFNKLNNSLVEWEEIAKKINILEMGKLYKDTCKKVKYWNVTNEWEEEKGSFYINYSIKNKTYGMFIRVYEHTRCKNGKHEPYEYVVSYNLYANCLDNVETIKSINRKKFTNKYDCLKYVEGRKKTFNNYFTELYPPVKKEYEHLYTCCGKLLEGYRIEEQ